MCAIRPNRSLALKHKQHGASIIAAVFLITGLAVLAALMTKLTIMGSKESINEWYSTQALYAADSGVDWAVYHILNNDSCETTGYPYSATVPVSTTSTVEIDISCSAPGKNGQTINYYHITVTGKAGSGAAQRQLSMPFVPTL